MSLFFKSPPKTQHIQCEDFISPKTKTHPKTFKKKETHTHTNTKTFFKFLRDFFVNAPWPLKSFFPSTSRPGASSGPRFEAVSDFEGDHCRPPSPLHIAREVMGGVQTPNTPNFYFIFLNLFNHWNFQGAKS